MYSFPQPADSQNGNKIIFLYQKISGTLLFRSRFIFMMVIVSTATMIVVMVIMVVVMVTMIMIRMVVMMLVNIFGTSLFQRC